MSFSEEEAKEQRRRNNLLKVIQSWDADNPWGHVAENQWPVLHSDGHNRSFLPPDGFFLRSLFATSYLTSHTWAGIASSSQPVNMPWVQGFSLRQTLFFIYILTS